MPRNSFIDPTCMVLERSRVRTDKRRIDETVSRHRADSPLLWIGDGWTFANARRAADWLATTSPWALPSNKAPAPEWWTSFHDAELTQLVSVPSPTILI